MKGLNVHIKNNRSLYMKFSFILAFVCSVVAALTGHFEGFPWDYSFYHLSQSSRFLYTLSFCLVILYGTPKLSSKWKKFVLLVVVLEFTGIGDEIANTATVLGLHDLFRALSSVITVLIIGQIKKGRTWRTLWL